MYTFTILFKMALNDEMAASQWKEETPSYVYLSCPYIYCFLCARSLFLSVSLFVINGIVDDNTRELKSAGRAIYYKESREKKNERKRREIFSVCTVYVFLFVCGESSDSARKWKCERKKKWNEKWLAKVLA